MIERASSKENGHFKDLISYYLKYGSVEGAMKNERGRVYVSTPSYHRLITEWGIVKSPGRNGIFSEVLFFLTRLLNEKTSSLEDLHKKMPPGFDVSVRILRSILKHIREGVPRRAGTALVTTPEGQSDWVLVGDDVSTPNPELGKHFGDVSLPMGFSNINEPPYMSVLRALQQEVSNPLVLERKLVIGSPDAERIIGKDPKPFMFVDVADVRVGVFHIVLPRGFCNQDVLSSGKLSCLRFSSVDGILARKERLSLRAGVSEALNGYQKAQMAPSEEEPYWEISELNRELALLPLYVKSSSYYL